MYEPYVADPAEPPPRPPLAGLRPAVVTAIVVLLLVAGAALFLQGRGEEDPALNAPDPVATTPG